MALIPKPDVTIRWAEGGNTLEPASEVQELGFVVEKPPYEVVNWLHNKHDTALAYLYQEGFSDWDVEMEYSNTSYVKYAGNIYKSLVYNFGKQPDLNPDVWMIAFANYQDLTNLEEDLNATKTVEGHAENLVYKSAPEFTNKAIGTSYSSNIGVGTNDGYQFNNHSRDGLFHNGSSPVVLNGGVTVASFTGNISSPAPKDVVTFEMLQRYLEIYKVGDIYITTDGENPAAKFGYGSWVRYAEGMALVGFNSDFSSSVPDWLKQVGRTFGSYTHTLTESEIPTIRAETPMTQAGRRNSDGEWTWLGDANGHANDTITDSYGLMKSRPFGGNQPHNNVQPSIVVYIWRRVS